MKRFRLFAAALFALLALCAASFAEDKPILKWGGDPEGNVPYMFMEPDNDKNMIGFEIYIVNALA